MFCTSGLSSFSYHISKYQQILPVISLIWNQMLTIYTFLPFFPMEVFCGHSFWLKRPFYIIYFTPLVFWLFILCASQGRSVRSCIHGFLCHLYWSLFQYSVSQKPRICSFFTDVCTFISHLQHVESCFKTASVHYFVLKQLFRWSFKPSPPHGGHMCFWLWDMQCQK